MKKLLLLLLAGLIMVPMAGYGATFGYTSVGGTEHDITEYIVKTIFSGAAGTGTSLSVYAGLYYGTYGNKGIKNAIYDSSRNLVNNGTTEEGTLTSTTPSWKTLNFSSSPIFTAQNYYITSETHVGSGFPFSGEGVRYYYDTGSANQGDFEYLTYTSYPAATISELTQNFKYSIYATYTASASTLANVKTINGVTTANTKTINGVTTANTKSFNGVQ